MKFENIINFLFLVFVLFLNFMIIKFIIPNQNLVNLHSINSINKKMLIIEICMPEPSMCLILFDLIPKLMEFCMHYQNYSMLNISLDNMISQKVHFLENNVIFNFTDVSESVNLLKDVKYRNKISKSISLLNTNVYPVDKSINMDSKNI